MYLHINMTGCKDTKLTGFHGLMFHMSVFEHLVEKKLNHRYVPYIQAKNWFPIPPEKLSIYAQFQINILRLSNYLLLIFLIQDLHSTYMLTYYQQLH